MKTKIYTEAAPAAIGPYSQAIQINNMTYFSGQIPLDPKSGALIAGDINAQTRQVFHNLSAVAMAANGHLDAIVKLTIYLTDLAYFSQVNEVMAQFFKPPYPARTTIQVSALPKGADIEIEAIMLT